MAARERIAGARGIATLVAVLFAALLHAPPARGQTEVSAGYRVTDDMRAKLLTPGDLTLRDASFVEAMFAVRRVWGVNVVVSNDLKQETVSCEFVETPLHEILDTLLTPRGYGYRPVGNSLVIVKQETLGAMKPLFQTATIPVLHANPKEIKEAVTFYLSERGQLQVVESARRLVVIDYPERIAQVTAKVKELDDAARGVRFIDGGQSGPTPGGPAGIADDPLLGGFNQKAAFFDLKHTKAEAVAPTLQPLLSTLGKISVLPYDNRLVAIDTPEKLLLIAQAVRELDVPRPQVRISALIYDAALEDIRRCGVNWNGTGFHSNNLNSGGIVQDSALLDAVTGAVPASGAANGALALTSLGSSFDVRVVIQALAQSKKSRLLADPNVTVYDQETAKIDIVTEIPFQQLTQSSQGGQIGTTAFREAGVSLQVTPQISDDETVTMIVNPVFSVLVGFTPENNQPIIDRRETSTTVRIRNRETLVIGGLKQKNSIGNRTGIPYLMNLHWPIGELFKTKDVTARDSELIVFITPELLDLCYLGQAREHDVYSASLPALEGIEAPRLPDDACPVEEWKHRCGCKSCKHGGHNGPCTAHPIHPGHLPPATRVYESPPVGTEVLPTPPPVERSAAPSDERPELDLFAPPDLRRAPIDPPAPPTPQPPLEESSLKVGEPARVSQRRMPVPLMKRLPAVEREEPARTARQSRDVLHPLPPVR